MTELEITRKVGKIQKLIEEYAACRGDMDSLKTAVQCFEIAQDPIDKEIADNMRDYWMETADQAH